MASHNTTMIFILGPLGSQFIMVASDIVAQVMEYNLELETIEKTRARAPAPVEEIEGSEPKQPPSFQLDCKRLGRWTLVTTVSGFFFQGWWYYMAYAFPGTSWYPVLQKTAATQAFNFFMIPAIQISLAALNPQVTVCEKLRQEWAVMQLFALLFLPVCHIIQFRYVPLFWQIYVSRANGFVCGLVISLISNRAMTGHDAGWYMRNVPEGCAGCCPPPQILHGDEEEEEAMKDDPKDTDDLNTGMPPPKADRCCGSSCSLM